MRGLMTGRNRSGRPVPTSPPGPNPSGPGRAPDAAKPEPSGAALGADRRQFPRHPASLAIKFDSGPAFARAYSAYTGNIGMGGLCILTRKAYAVGTRLHLRLELMDRHLELTGAVAWAREGAAIGVRFDPLSADQKRVVTELVSELVAEARKP